MQKKILSAVFALCLVGSASSAFAEGYYHRAPSLDVDVNNKSFNNDSFNRYDIDVTKNYTKTITKTNVDVVAQGNLVAGHIVVQQFGQGGSGSGMGGDMLTVDNSINGSTLGSYNISDSYNKTRTSTRTSTRNLDVNVDISNSLNRTFQASQSFNYNGLGGLLHEVP